MRRARGGGDLFEDWEDVTASHDFGFGFGVAPRSEGEVRG